MIQRKFKSIRKATSVYAERKAKIRKRNLEFNKQTASFCVNNCPHKNKSCGNTPCIEYREFEKKLRETLTKL